MATRTGLPPRERPVEDNGQSELIYLAGGLRLYRFDQDSLYALVVDHTLPAYQEFKDLGNSAGFVVAHQGKYTSVVRTAAVDQSVRDELASRNWTEDELKARFGEPTHRMHNHGIGTFTVIYVPQGLEFEQADTLKLVKTSADEIWRNEATSHVSSPNYTDQLLTKGKPSPDGKFQAAYLKGGGYWSQWIVVRPVGRSEITYHANYFIEDYFWLDNRRLVYGEAQMSSNYLFHVIDAVAEKEVPSISVDDEVKQFGVEGGQIWYIGKDGARHMVTVP